MKHKICAITGSRAEYSSYLPLLKAIRDDDSFILQIVATGMHLSQEFGLTYKEIEKDGFTIDEKVDVILFGDTTEGVSKSIGLGVMKIAEVLGQLKPDFMLLIGDRFETLSAAIAAFVARIPIAHVGGGDLSLGALDDGFRHSITKMSQLHFTSTEKHRLRVIQMGENPDKVFVSGAPGIDNIKSLHLLEKEELEKHINFNLDGKIALVTFHPATLNSNTAGDQFKELLFALDRFDDLKVVFTKPNADVGGKMIIDLIDEYVIRKPERSIAFTSMGQVNYLSLLKMSYVVIGNSSSGIVEAPFFGKPTANIGDRQSGRDKAECIIDCEVRQEDIYEAICKSLTPEFNSFCSSVSNLYGDGKAAEKILKTIKREFRNIINTKKSFYDIPCKENGKKDTKDEA